MTLDYEQAIFAKVDLHKVRKDIENLTNHCSEKEVILDHISSIYILLDKILERNLS